MTTDSNEQIVLDCLGNNYGLGGALQRLPGENLNYLLTGAAGLRHVVKIVDDHVPTEVVQMEFQAIEHVSRKKLTIDFPIIIKNINKNIETRISLHKNVDNRLILMNFVKGKNLHNCTDISDVLLKNLGVSLAEFDLAMEGFDHPASRRAHRWDLADASQHREKYRLLKVPERRELLKWGFDTWQSAREALGQLPQQVIHGDANPENILVVGEEINGLVDFGDMCWNPTICELAICLSYIMSDCRNSFGDAAIACHAYNQARPLSEAECAVLFPLICGRLSVSIAMSTARRKIDPDNPNWFSGEPGAWRLLSSLRSAGADSVTSAITSGI